MINREVVVRIVQPAEKAEPARREVLPEMLEESRPDKAHHAFNVLGLGAIIALTIFLGLNFFSLGIAVKDIIIILGLPVALGLITSYALF